MKSLVSEFKRLTADHTVVLAGLIFIGLVAPALIGFSIFENSLLGYFTVAEALGLSLSLPFIYFSSTLFYMFVIGSDAITTERECLAAALAVTVLSFGIDFAYCGITGLSLKEFATALILLYAFFFGCFLFVRVREISRL